MELVHERCAGLDVHSEVVVATMRRGTGRQVERETKSFLTCTKSLLELRDWLESQGCTHVAMEATGVYWKPVWHVLEGGFELLLANAAQVKALPGRKTDVKDSEWLAELLAHGLVRSSFVPPEPFQDLRDLVRTRKQLVAEASRHVQRLQATLEDANVKIHNVLSDVMGASGQDMVRALASGVSDPAALAALARPGVKAPKPQVIESLRGRVREHHRFMLKLHLDQIDGIRTSIKEVEQRIARCLEPFRAPRELLLTIPGISHLTAAMIIAEIGVDMSRFPTPANLISWAGLCPSLDESAGKRRSSRIRGGSRWLKEALVQAAWAAVRVKGSSLQARFQRIKSRRGAKKAIVAVASALLGIVHHVLSNGVVYQEMGPTYLDQRTRTKIASKLTRRLEALGYRVEIIQPAA